MDETQEELDTRRTREHDAFARHPKVRGTDLQQRNADEDPRHQREVVLQPLLKLGHAAFNVDVVLLLGVLRAHRRAFNSVMELMDEHVMLVNHMLHACITAFTCTHTLTGSLKHI